MLLRSRGGSEPSSTGTNTLKHLQSSRQRCGAVVRMRTGPITCMLSHADTRAKKRRSHHHDSARVVLELVGAQAVDDIDGTVLDSG